MKINLRDRLLPTKGSNVNTIINQLNYKTIFLIFFVIGVNQLQVNIKTNYAVFELFIYQLIYFCTALEIIWTIIISFLNSFQETKVFRSIKPVNLTSKLTNEAMNLIEDFYESNEEIRYFWVEVNTYLNLITLLLYFIVALTVVSDGYVVVPLCLLYFVTLRKLQALRSIHIIKHNLTLITTEIILSEKSN